MIKPEIKFLLLGIFLACPELFCGSFRLHEVLAFASAFAKFLLVHLLIPCPLELLCLFDRARSQRKLRVIHSQSTPGGPFQPNPFWDS